MTEDVVSVIENGRTYQFTTVDKLLEWEQKRGVSTRKESKQGTRNKSKAVALRWQRERIVQEELGLSLEDTRQLLKTLKDEKPNDMKFLDDKEKLLKLAAPLALKSFKSKLTQSGRELLKKYEALKGDV